MREDFRELARLEARVERNIKIMQHPDGLISCHQG